jgi:glyoxylase-like metal-dependent hydrolase (beta-lactamase superfamily II)/rhodanese-related sulfurtransferase
MITTRVIDTPSLGDRSHLAHDGSVALVVDPQRDIDRVLDRAQDEGVRITHVLETHLHNDYVTGGLALARATGAVYLVNAADDVAFERTPIRDGETVEISPTMSVRAIATPGHTFTHLSYALLDGGEVVGVFTGGSLLFGSTGRPDLLGPDHTHDLLGHQFRSAHRLAEELPDTAAVLPTHGFGSFCSATQTSGDASTIGAERTANPVLSLAEADWAEQVLAGHDAFPAYYAHMGPANAAGPGPVDLAPPAPADAASVRAALDAGEWVVDLRHRVAFAAGHVPGTFNIGLDGQFATYLGWLIPWGTPLTLLGDKPEQVDEAQRELVRIGVDQLAGAATGAPEGWGDRPLDSFPRASFVDLRAMRHHREVTILDVRRDREWEAGRLDGSLHIPLHELPRRVAELPDGEVWVHCAGGYRASIAASIVAAAGHRVVAVDDSFDNAAEAGLQIVSEAA